MAKILVIEDDRDVIKVVKDSLVLEGHTVETIESGDKGSEHLKQNQYDLVVLDWMLPKLTGIEILKELRTSGNNTPVLMLTGQDVVDSRAEGLESGADDYLTKPFHVNELCARVRAILRRCANKGPDKLRLGTLELDPLSFTVTNAGEEIRLAPREFALLEFLMKNPNRAFSAEILLSKVWTDEDESNVESVRTCVKRLRKKLAETQAASMLQTDTGSGYKLALP
jgi:DNA-binding response OmpR family regulator